MCNIISYQDPTLFSSRITFDLYVKTKRQTMMEYGFMNISPCTSMVIVLIQQ